MTDLTTAYQAIMLRWLRRTITREERDAKVAALHNDAAAAGLSFEDHYGIANEAARRALAIMAEVSFSESGRWQ